MEAAGIEAGSAIVLLLHACPLVLERLSRGCHGCCIEKTWDFIAASVSVRATRTSGYFPNSARSPKSFRPLFRSFCNWQYVRATTALPPGQTASVSEEYLLPPAPLNNPKVASPQCYFRRDVNHSPVANCVQTLNFVPQKNPKTQPPTPRQEPERKANPELTVPSPNPQP